MCNIMFLYVKVYRQKINNDGKLHIKFKIRFLIVLLIDKKLNVEKLKLLSNIKSCMCT